MKKIVIIPARYTSTRLPGKPLLDICGKPMIVRVCEQVASESFDDFVVATDNAQIKEAVESNGYKAIMTSEHHISGTDRLKEAADILKLDDDDIIINLQGDEPLMPIKNLHQVTALLERRTDASVATLFEMTDSGLASGNPNIVKLVTDRRETVLYFSRANIPFDRDNKYSDVKIKRHVGLYAYRKKALDAFVSFSEGELEKIEKLEQLRFMENGHCLVAEEALLPIPIGVDTAEDLEATRQHFKRLNA